MSSPDTWLEALSSAPSFKYWEAYARERGVQIRVTEFDARSLIEWQIEFVPLAGGGP